MNLSQDIIKKMKNRKWMVTYDNAKAIKDMYTKVDWLEFELCYTLQEKKIASEIMFFSRVAKRPKKEEELIKII